MGAQAVRLSNVDIDNALKNRDFEVLFQPIFDLGNGALARMETFVRWRHPSLGVLPPGAFISFFESQGRMSELSRYVLNEAMSGYLKWRGNYGPGFSINLALTDLNDEALASHLTVLLREHDFPADAVTLECPMPPVTTDPERAREQFEKLRKTGARLAIEVRGRANEFLRNVDPFPFDEVKTGGAAILRFARTVRGPGLSAISELLDIANKANASITAVGVEDQASLSALRGLGFSAAQGNHLAKVGGLGDFRPTMVNDVRKLLDLEDLSNAELGDLFRTGQMDKASASDLPDMGDSDAIVATGTLVEDDGDVETQDAPSQVENPTKSAEPNVQESTADRARRKAAILAKKKGKDALRAEIAARRKRLGLSASSEGVSLPSSAAKKLQDRLTSEFEDLSESETDSAIVEEQSQESKEDILTSDHVDGQLSQQVNEEVLEDDLFADDVVISDQEKYVETVISEDLSESAPEINGLDADQVESPVDEVVDNADLTLQETSVANEDGNEVGADVDGHTALDQEIVQDVTRASQSAEALFDEKVKPKNATSDAASVQTPEAEPLSPGVENHVSMSIADARAYLSDVWHATIEPHTVEQISSLEAQDIQEQRAEMEENLVLFSLDEKQPVSAEGNNPSSMNSYTEVEVDTEEEHNLVFVDAGPLPGDSTDILGVSSASELNADPVTSLENEAMLSISENMLDSQPEESNFIASIETEGDELSLIEESIVIADNLQNTKRKSKKNFLMRKYRLWPDHFWPRSWTRAWARRQANKDFVRRAKLRAAETLGGSQTDSISDAI